MAVGEIGIDLYHNDSEVMVLLQQAALANLSAAAEGLPIVLHVRDRRDNQEAGAMCCEILSDSVSRAQKIQLHSFDSGLDEQRRWKEAFPGAMFSISRKLLSADRHQELDQVVQGMDLDSLLLETDAPYLCPKEIRSTQHGPASISLVANRVGELRNSP